MRKFLRKIFEPAKVFEPANENDKEDLDQKCVNQLSNEDKIRLMMKIGASGFSFLGRRMLERLPFSNDLPKALLAPLL
jgi:hypothetical protein